MKHCRLALPFAASYWSPVAVSLVLACTRPAGDATLLIDSTLLDGSSEVVAVPVDPLSLRTRRPISTRPASLADSLATAAALRDSADRLDDVFQRERDSLNAEARLLQSLPSVTRRSPEYAGRYDSFTSRLETAQRARAQRDALRSRASRLRAMDSSPDPAIRAGLLNAVDGDRRTIVARAAPVVRLRLASGEWWIGLAGAGQAPARFTRVTLAGHGDTVRFPAP